MIYGSVCSGIEAATVAWEPLGWRASFFSEIEAFPRAVLHHRFPHVPLHGDFTTIKADEYEPIDLLVGGTPCQSFSIAGLRGGLGDDRGNLSLQFLRLADRTRARWVLWENVPGVLSSFEGRDFGAIITGLVELGYSCAWRILDAQYFGVAQRRRRVFLVGHSGGWRGAAAVLFERASLQGHSPPRRETRESVAGTLGGSSQSGGFRTTDLDNSGAFIPVCFGGNRTSGPIDVTPALLAQPGSGFKCDFESETFITHSLRGEGFDASEDGTGRGTPLVPVAFSAKDHGADAAYDCSPTLRAMGHAASHPNGGGQVAVAFQSSQSGVRVGETHATLDANNGSRRHNGIALAAAVRRLTPRECERLQGFPDDYTAIPWRGKPAAECPDGPRYKALGNSMAVPVVRWIGHRIAMVDAILKGGA
jgi:DNA (cytosine-5)-methyltransferase 1